MGPVSGADRGQEQDPGPSKGSGRRPTVDQPQKKKRALRVTAFFSNAEKALAALAPPFYLESIPWRTSTDVNRAVPLSNGKSVLGFILSKGV